MVNRQQAADRFAHDIIERLRGMTFTQASAEQVKAAVTERTEPHPADTMVEHVVHCLTYALPAGILTDEHVARIVRAASAAGQRPHEFHVPSQTNAERDAGRVPGDTDRPRYRRLGDNPQA